MDSDCIDKASKIHRQVDILTVPEVHGKSTLALELILVLLSHILEETDSLTNKTLIGRSDLTNVYSS